MAEVGIIMGSDSDMPVMKQAIDVLKSFDIEVEVDIVSAHRTPEKLFEYMELRLTKKVLRSLLRALGVLPIFQE